MESEGGRAKSETVEMFAYMLGPCCQADEPHTGRATHFCSSLDTLWDGPRAPTVLRRAASGHEYDCIGELLCKLWARRSRCALTA